MLTITKVINIPNSKEGGNEQVDELIDKQCSKQMNI